MSRVFQVAPSPFEVDHVHALIQGEAYAASHAGTIPRNAFWRDLEFRYERNPDAFSIVHGNFKLFLDRLSAEHGFNHDSCVIPPRWTGLTRSNGTCPESPSVPVEPFPSSAPEPGSIVIASIALGVWITAAFLFRVVRSVG